uniref:Serpentine receptor class gamma n=1 Tax=Meloidogyne floridensis TaxID=298350 RepID=A0A915NTI9_9BILA
MHFVCIILPGINNTFAYFKIYSDNFTIDFANQCVFIIVTIGSFLIELFLLIYHPFLRRNFFRLLCSLFCCRMLFPVNKIMQVPPTTDTNILTQSNIRTGKNGGALKDINGKPLIIKGKKEDLGEAYFQQLVNSWN